MQTFEQNNSLSKARWIKTVATAALTTVFLLGGCATANGLGKATDMPSLRPTIVEAVGTPLRIVGNFKPGADPELMDILNEASMRAIAYQVEAFSGFREGDRRFHGRGLAVDVRLLDRGTGKSVPNYQQAASFRIYEKFAQIARQVQMERYPELDTRFRWGGYFSGQPGKYGAVDLMHFDLGGDKVGMGGGSGQGTYTSPTRDLANRSQHRHRTHSRD